MELPYQTWVKDAMLRLPKEPMQQIIEIYISSGLFIDRMLILSVS